MYGKVILQNLIIRLLNKENVCHSLNFCFEGEKVEDVYDFANRVLKGKEKKTKGERANGWEDVDWGAKTLKMMQLTDIHFDAKYVEGASAECERVLCCRDPASNHSRITAGKFGFVGKCDANLELLRSFGEKAREIQPDFLLLTGDNGPHDMWDESQEVVYNATKTLINVIKEYLGDITVFPILGNHEKYPSDLFTENETELLSHFADLYSPFFTDEEALSSFRKFGYYTTLYKNSEFNSSKLRIVAMNCLLCDTWNHNLIKGNHDAAKEEFIWLEKVLGDAEKNGEFVYILEHIPINGNFYLTECGLRLKALIDRYSYNVRAVFSGHTHNDDVVPIYEYFEPRPLISINYVAPSFTTNHYTFPSFRYYLLETSTFNVVDYYQYRLNVTEANKNGFANWTLAYKATEFFNVTSMSQIEDVFKYKVDEKYIIKRYAGAPKGYSNAKKQKEFEEAECHLSNDNFRDFCNNLRALKSLHKSS